jgi:acetyl esterase/lipase
VRVFSEIVGEGTATLTGYVLDRSTEMGNAAIRPAVLVLPGGGYFLTSDREAEPVALAYLAEGFNAFVLRYRVGAEAPFEHSYADGSAALAWIREHASAVDVDPTKLAVVGFSAGGHLAASLGAVGEHRPDALVLGYPVTLEEFGPLVGKDILDVASAVTEAMPPTFLFGTSGDSLVPVRNSLDLLAALAAHGVPFESHIYLLGPHGISLAKPMTAGTAAAMVNASVAQWLPESVRFLHDVFGDFAVEGEVESYRTLMERSRFGLDAPAKRLLADPRAVEVLERHVPQLVSFVEAHPAAEELSIRDVAALRPEEFPESIMEALGEDLQRLNNQLKPALSQLPDTSDRA